MEGEEASTTDDQDGGRGSQEPNAGPSVPPDTNTSTPEPPPSIPNEPRVTVIGRTSRLDPNSDLGHHYGTTAVTFKVRFEGPRLALKMTRHNTHGFPATFNRWIDGQQVAPVRVATAQEQTVVMADGLAATEHTLWWTYISALEFGAVDQLILADETRLMTPPPAARPHRIEAVGGSACSGYGVLDNAPNCVGVRLQDSTLAWPQLAGVDLDADVTNSCIAGMGLALDTSSETKYLAKKCWPLIYCDDPTSAWTRGQDDFLDVLFMDTVGVDWTGAGRSPTTGLDGLADPAAAARWQQAALDFIDQVLAVYPQAAIYLLINIGVVADRRPALVPLLQATITKANDRGHPRVRMIEVPYDPTGQAACGQHPSAAGHRKMADLIVARVRADLGWPAAAASP